MNLTPVRIRGKKRPAIDQRAHSKRSVNTRLDTSSNKRRLVPAVTNPIRPTTRFRRLSTLSSLEALPTELLEDIFLRCLNISLPQCSPILGQKLASNRTKHQLLLRTCSVGRNGLYFKNKDILAAIQSAILNTRWMTLPFLRHCIPEYMIQTLVRELSRRRLHWLGGETIVTRETEPTIREYIRAMFPLNPKETKIYHEVQWKEADPDRLIILCFGPIDGVVGLNIIDEVSSLNPNDNLAIKQRQSHKWRLLSFEPGCRIPDKLLRGGWTDEKCDLLDVVIRANAKIDWDRTTSGETAQKGFKEALETCNIRAIKSLIVRKHPEALPGERKDFFNEEEFARAHVGIVPTTEHLRDAVLKLDCQTDIVKALLYAPESRIDALDGEVRAWVSTGKSNGDPKATWLEKMLEWFQDTQTRQRLAVPAAERSEWFLNLTTL